MDRIRVAAALSALLLLPALAFAQTQAPPQPPDWKTSWAGPIFLGAAVVLLGLRALPPHPVLRAVGTVLWLLVLTAGGGFAIYAMPNAFRSASWYLPVFFASFGVFLYAAEQALQKLKGPPRRRQLAS